MAAQGFTLKPGALSVTRLTDEKKGYEAFVISFSAGDKRIAEAPLARHQAVGFAREILRLAGES